MLARLLTHHPQVGAAPHPFFSMARIRRLTALALARAMLAGPPGVAMSAASLAARIAECMAQCLGRDAPWQQDMAKRAAAMPGEHWRRWQPRTLADWIERQPGYQAAWRAVDKDARPTARGYIVRPRLHKLDAPLGLDKCLLPDLPHAAALAQWLGLSTEALWRLTRPAAWQRRAPLVQQHHAFRLLAKRRGGWRLLEVPMPHLLGLQRKVLAGLLDAVPPHEAACGFRAGHSVLDHAGAHSGQAVLIKFDLQDFFSAVQASRVHALYATLGYPDEVARLLTALCTVATPEPVLARMHEAGHLAWPQRQRLRDAHLPQGASTSPALANLCAFRLDLRLDGLAHALGARYTRYADDIVLSGPDSLRQALPRVRIWVSRIVAEEGFALNAAKTHRATAGQRQQVCGIVVNQRLNLPRDEFDRLKALLHQCVRLGPASQNREGLPHWREHLAGRVGWVAQLNAAKAQRLQRLFDRIVWPA